MVAKQGKGEDVQTVAYTTRTGHSNHSSRSQSARTMAARAFPGAVARNVELGVVEVLRPQASCRRAMVGQCGISSLSSLRGRKAIPICYSRRLDRVVVVEFSLVDHYAVRREEVGDPFLPEVVPDAPGA